jgi:hypothetical protein
LTGSGFTQEQAMKSLQESVVKESDFDVHVASAKGNAITIHFK